MGTPLGVESVSGFPIQAEATFRTDLRSSFNERSRAIGRGSERRDVGVHHSQALLEPRALNVDIILSSRRQGIPWTGRVIRHNRCLVVTGKRS